MCDSNEFRVWDRKGIDIGAKVSSNRCNPACNLCS